MRRWRVLFTLLVWTAAVGAFDRATVPPALAEWIPWVLDAIPDHACPPGATPEVRECVWPTRLSLDLAQDGGSFTLHADVYQAAWVTLPGGGALWPQDVTLDGVPAVVLDRAGAPALRAGAGRHVIAGRFAWPALPETLAVPAAAALIDLRVAGQPRRAEPLDGRLYLTTGAGDAAPVEEADGFTVQVVRRLVDEQPFELLTRLVLDVTGRQREVTLPAAQWPGTEPLRLDSPLPARLEPNGDLRLQVRPGHHEIELVTRHLAPVTALTLAAHPAPWPDEEIWSFEARPALRLVVPGGVASVDPAQTRVPSAWHALPAFRVTAGDTLTLDVRRRGDPEPAPDQLTVQREMWLDFDGGGLTVNDTLRGRVSRAWRLAADPALELGKVALNGTPQAITSLDGTQRGIEVRRGDLELVADARYTGPFSRIPAVGWAHDVDSLAIRLHLPPGWRLWSAQGIDSVADTWLLRWTLLDLFLVLIATIAAARLWHWPAAALTGVTLAALWHEPEAPRQIWLHLLAAIALLRVLPAGRLRMAVAGYRTAAAVVLAAAAVVFSVGHLRAGVYPQLEYPYPVTSPPEAPQHEVAAAAGLADMAGAVLSARVRSESYEKSSPGRPTAAPAAIDVTDPDAKVQTGPGLPRWQWNQVELGWQGPVLRDQTFSLVLISPGVNRVLALARVVALAALCLFLLRGLRPPPAPARPSGVATSGGAGPGEPAPGDALRDGEAAHRVHAGGVSAGSAALLLIGFVFGSPRVQAASPAPPAHAAPEPAAAEIATPAPSPSDWSVLLEALKSRLLAPPDCHPDCAALARAALRIEADILSLTLDVQVEAASRVALPGRAGQWLPTEVRIDQESTPPALLRTVDGTLVAALAPGLHRILMQGPLPARARVELPFGLAPRALVLASDGWRIEGLPDGDTTVSQLLLVREPRAAGARALDALEARALPPFFAVERTLTLGLDWRVTTQVLRLTPPGTAAALEVPLLDGEAVTQDGIAVADGHVRLNLAAGQTAVAWSSVMAPRPTLSLVAPETQAWRETWRADIAPLWHAKFDGIAVVHHADAAGRWLPEWRPLPGERVDLSLSRPAGVPGQTLTIDRSELALSPGARALDATLALTLRSSQGGQHALTLPEEAVLQQVSIDEVPQALRLEGRTLMLPLTPGTREVRVTWRQSRPLGARFDAPPVSLGGPSVNGHIVARLPEDHWILLTLGPRLGPAVLFWPTLLVIAGLASALGRSRLTPLSAWQWGLLGVGLSQTSLVGAGLVVGWLFAFALRARIPGPASGWRYDALQIGLAALTVLALSMLFDAIQQGLLGAPDMQIAGNGSHAYELRWFQDRSDGALPAIQVWSVPLWVYRVLMLAWSLWLAVAILGWLRWSWRVFARDGIWRPWWGPRSAAPAEAGAPVAPTPSP